MVKVTRNSGVYWQPLPRACGHSIVSLFLFKMRNDSLHGSKLKTRILNSYNAGQKELSQEGYNNHCILIPIYCNNAIQSMQLQ